MVHAIANVPSAGYKFGNHSKVVKAFKFYMSTITFAISS
jgi:hypothetical protein